jgi:hypothetical protein
MGLSARDINPTGIALYQPTNRGTSQTTMQKAHHTAMSSFEATIAPPGEPMNKGFADLPKPLRNNLLLLASGEISEKSVFIMNHFTLQFLHLV